MESETLNDSYIEKLLILKAVCDTEAGIALMQWIHHLTGFARATMAMEDAARRDVWLTLRPFIPVDKLSAIEHEFVREKQKQILTMIESAQVIPEDEG